jgi:hypothetical protein
MAKKDPSATNGGPAPESPMENGDRRSWAEEHGGLIFLMIVSVGILLVVLYEVFMN